MNVTIIGAGNMARALGIRLVSGGHSVNLHARNKDHAAAITDDLQEFLQNGATVNIAAYGDPPDDVVILAVPYDSIDAVVEDYEDELAGKIVVDISNPVDFQTLELLTPPDIASAEEVAELLPDSRIVKAFNTAFAPTLAEGDVGGQPLDVFIAGDDDSAKNTVAGLIADGGLRALDVGLLSTARYLEGFQLLHIALQQQLGANYHSAIKIIQ